MKAQLLYDFREKKEFCSGTDLHEFFREQVGDPSPSGTTEIDATLAREFVVACSEQIYANNKSPKWLRYKENVISAFDSMIEIERYYKQKEK